MRGALGHYISRITTKGHYIQSIIILFAHLRPGGSSGPLGKSELESLIIPTLERALVAESVLV